MGAQWLTPISLLAPRILERHEQGYGELRSAGAV